MPWGHPQAAASTGMQTGNKRCSSWSHFVDQMIVCQHRGLCLAVSRLGINTLTKGLHTWGATQQVPQTDCFSICSVLMRNLADVLV